MTPTAKFLLLMGLVAVFTILTALHTGNMNGPAYWKWPWRDLAPVPVTLTVLLAGTPVVIAAVLARTLPRTALALIVFGAAALQWSGSEINGPDAQSRIRAVVESPAATSYYTHAQTLAPDWLADYPQVLSEGEHHARNKPPGPVWFYRTILDANVSDPALLGGMLVGGLALLSVVATFGLSRAMGQGNHAATLAAALMATAPSFALFFPEFDQVFAGIGAVMVATWLNALKRPPDSLAIPAAASFGLVLSLSLLWSYSLLTLGVFLAFVTLAQCLRTGHWRIITARATIALLVVTLIHLGLWIWTGYDPVATFQVALDNQRDLLMRIARPWPLTVPFDLLDLFLGMGWVMTALLVMELAQPLSGFTLSRQHIQLAVFSVLVIVVTGLLPGETARVLMFIMPLLAVGAGAQLVRWPRSLQVGALVLALLGLSATLRTMVFIAV